MPTRYRPVTASTLRVGDKIRIAPPAHPLTRSTPYGPYLVEEVIDYQSPEWQNSNRVVVARAAVVAEHPEDGDPTVIPANGSGYVLNAGEGAFMAMSPEVARGFDPVIEWPGRVCAAVSEPRKKYQPGSAKCWLLDADTLVECRR